MRVLFWGTPEFGLPTLDAMRAAGHDVVGVVTNPDRPAGRGRRLRASPVKQWALEADVPVLQPERPRGEAFMAEAAALSPDISVVAAYGQILRQEVLDLPRLGSINVHGSLLPELRGAAPINWAIIRGHAESGATIMRMVLAMDAGPMLAHAPVPIGPDTTAGELYAAVADAGAPALVEVLAALDEGTAAETPQDDAAATFAPKMDRAMARIDWALPAVEVGRWIRGCDPWPAAWTEHDGTPVQCFRPEVDADADAGSTGERAEPGTVLEAHPTDGLVVATGDGTLRIREVKPAGRRRMTAAEWVRGSAGLEGSRFA